MKKSLSKQPRWALDKLSLSSSNLSGRGVLFENQNGFENQKGVCENPFPKEKI